MGIYGACGRKKYPERSGLDKMAGSDIFLLKLQWPCHTVQSYSFLSHYLLSESVSFKESIPSVVYLVVRFVLVCIHKLPRQNAFNHSDVINNVSLEELTFA